MFVSNYYKLCAYIPNSPHLDITSDYSSNKHKKRTLVPRLQTIMADRDFYSYSIRHRMSSNEFAGRHCSSEEVNINLKKTETYQSLVWLV